MIYTSEHYSTAMLEKLVHANRGKLPPNQHFIKITIPNGLSYEVLSTANVPAWADPSQIASKAYGEQWQQSGRSVLLLVPSVVACEENNILINPSHPEFPKITASLHQPIWWDQRLF